MKASVCKSCGRVGSEAVCPCSVYVPVSVSAVCAKCGELVRHHYAACGSALYPWKAACAEALGLVAAAA